MHAAGRHPPRHGRQQHDRDDVYDHRNPEGFAPARAGQVVLEFLENDEMKLALIVDFRGRRGGLEQLELIWIPSRLFGLGRWIEVKNRDCGSLPCAALASIIAARRPATTLLRYVS